ncbi:18 kDa heat shock protein [bioreactor metagenome]|uniref:18 kDa heat shock protein n=1 Tax=bioreactor metagenome TaxID=1076179 RepID=A0A645GVU9_9ZZZZ
MFGLVPFNQRRGQMQNADDRFFDMDRVMEQFLNDAVFPGFFSQSGLMKVDICDAGDTYILEAELPGIKKENVHIETDDGQLTIAVEQDSQNEEKRESYIRRERRSSSMRRSFSLENIDAERISARMENGVLLLRLPKLKANPPAGRRIDIE